MQSSAVFQTFYNLPGLFLASALLFLPEYFVPYFKAGINSSDNYLIHDLGVLSQRCRYGNPALPELLVSVAASFFHSGNV